MLGDIGCTFITSNAYDALQNGVAERSNSTLVELARTNLIASGLKKSLWAESLNYSVQVLNATTINKITNQSAFQMVHSRRPYFREFYASSTDVVFLDQRPGRPKFDPKGIRGHLVGLNGDVFGYRIWQPGTRRTIATKHVTFLKPGPFAIKGTVSTQQNDNDRNIFEDKPTNTSEKNDEARIVNKDEQAASSSQNDETGSARRQVEIESQQPQKIQQPAVRPKSTQPQPERRRSSSSEHGQPLSSDQPAAAHSDNWEREKRVSRPAEPSTSRPPSDSETE